MGRIPLQRTSFVGRHAEIRDVLALIGRSRLVTLTGPAGVGKTRLAIEVARHVDSGEFDSVYFVDLARLRDATLVDSVFIAELGGRPERGRTALETIAGLLAGFRSLVLIDNCEHLVDAVAHLVDHLAGEVEGLSVLATSREALGIAGETTKTIPPLRDTDAARLFMERAQLVDASFPDAGPNATLLELCRRLDGLPLAIELAAARTRQMPVAEILRRLDDRLKLLDKGERFGSTRHRNLEAAISWSYEVLGLEQRNAFASLSVFVGGFDVAAAEAVAACSLESITRLVDKSMVTPQIGVGDRARFRLLDTLRLFARDRLTESGGECEARRLHFKHFKALTTKAAPELRGRHQVEWLDRLDEELPNLRAALEWGETDDPAATLAVAVDLIWFWKTRGHLAEGRDWLKRLAVAAPAPPETLATALTEAADFASQLGDGATAGLELDHVLQLWMQLGDPQGIARTLLSKAWHASRTQVQLGELSLLAEQAVDNARCAANEHLLAECLTFRAYVRREGHNYDGGRADLHEAVNISRRHGDIWTLALAVHFLAWQDYSIGRYDSAVARFVECLDLYRVTKDPLTTGLALAGLGLVRLAQHDDQGARKEFENSLTLEGTSLRHPLALLGLAQIAAREGAFERALKLYGAGWSMSWVGIRQPKLALEVQPWAKVARRTLGSEAADAALHDGEAMSITQAIAYALSDADKPPTGNGPLTFREMEIAARVARGLRNKEIAAELHISTRTVDAHVEHIRNKLGYQARAQVAAWAAEHGLARN